MNVQRDIDSYIFINCIHFSSFDWILIREFDLVNHLICRKYILNDREQLLNDLDWLNVLQHWEVNFFHLGSMHLGLKPWKTNENQAKKSNITVLKKQQKFKCSDCDYTSSKNEYVIDHIKKSHQKTFKCNPSFQG